MYLLGSTFRDVKRVDCNDNLSLFYSLEHSVAKYRLASIKVCKGQTHKTYQVNSFSALGS